MTNIKLKTTGMHCPSCEMLVKDSLEELKGVKKAEVSHKSGIVEVDFDEKTKQEEIIKVIEEEGYKVKWSKQ